MIEVTAPLPPDFTALVDALRRDAAAAKKK